MSKITEHREFILQLEKEEKRTSAKEVKVSFFSVELDKNTAHFFIYRPSHFQEDTSEDTIYPTILHIRGTGYNTSASYYANIICSQLAEKSHCQVIDIDHRLAPEFKCPVGFNDSYAKIKYICNNPKIFKVDLNNVAILGYSSGGNFAALSAIQAKKDNLPISLQILVSPLTDLSHSLESHLSFENEDTFPLPLAEWFINLYLSDLSKEERKSPSISPYWSKLNDLKHLPPTFFLFGEFDRFRGDSENYIDKLIEAGVKVKRFMFKNAGHIFFWKKIRAIETIAAQVYTAFNLSTIQRPIEKIGVQVYVDSNLSTIQRLIEKRGVQAYTVCSLSVIQRLIEIEIQVYVDSNLSIIQKLIKERGTQLCVVSNLSTIQSPIKKRGVPLCMIFNLSTIQRPIEKKEEVFEEKTSKKNHFLY